MIYIILLMIFVASFYFFDYFKMDMAFAPYILFIVLWLFSGTRQYIGVDYTSYKEMYDDPSNIGNLFLEPLWIDFADFLRVCGFTSRAWFLSTSFVIVGLFLYGIKKLSIDYYLSVLLFVLGAFYFESMNGVRQYVAMGILFAAFHLVLEGKMILYLIFIVIASQFHTSALFMIPMIFIVKINFPRRPLMFFLLLTFVFGSKLMDLSINYVSLIFEEEKYGAHISNFSDTEVVSTGLLRVFLNIVAISVLLVYDNIIKTKIEYFIYVNMVVIGVMFYNVFMTFQVLMRLYWYLFPYIIILFPIFLKSFTIRSRIIVTFVFVFLFTAFFLKMQMQSNQDVGFDFDLLK